MTHKELSRLVKEMSKPTEAQLRISAENAINHPKHYTFGKIEVIDVIDDWKLSYELSSVIKYVARAGKKDPLKTVEDLKKAAWYLNRELENLAKGNT